MNEKQKTYMKKQQKGVYDNLSTYFNLPIFEDDVAEDEEQNLPNDHNYFLLIYGDIESTESTGYLSQEIYVTYITEDNEFVDEQTLDIISLVSNVPGINFSRSIKQRLQKKDTDDYLDQVTVIFRRKMTYECKI
jgi:hypothetical protein